MIFTILENILNHFVYFDQYLTLILYESAGQGLMLGEKKGQTRFYFAENDGIITSAVPKIKDFDYDENLVTFQCRTSALTVRGRTGQAQLIYSVSNRAKFPRGMNPSTVRLWKMQPLFLAADRCRHWRAVHGIARCVPKQTSSV